STSRWVTARTVRGPSAPMRTPRARRRCTAVGASSVPRHVEQDDLGLDVGGSTLFGRHPYIGMQIEPLELLDRVPLQVQFRGNVLDTRGAAAPPYVAKLLYCVADFARLARHRYRPVRYRPCADSPPFQRPAR